MKYSPKTIKKACAMYAKGIGVNKICQDLGISTHTVVYFHCDPQKRRENIERTMNWMKKNRKRWREIANRASRKYEAKKRNRRRPNQ